MRATSLARPRARPGTGHGAGPGLAAGVPAPPRDRHHRRGVRPVRACPGTGSPGAPASPTPPAGPTPGCRPRRGRSSRRTSTGVNDGLHADAPELEALDLEPAPWEEWTPLAVFHAQHLLFASLPGKLWSARAREVLGDDAGLLSHEGPLPSGSNAWAVGGDRTASGFPLVAGDPHRTIESPGVYQQIRLACDEFDVAGFAFPGVPGVQHFAHAGDVAWAITNAMADYQDVYAERLRREGGRVEALGPGRLGAGDASRSRRSRCSGADPRRGRDRDHGPGAGVLRQRRRGAAGSACAPPRRSWATSASTRSSRCCAPAPSTTWTRALDAWVEPVNNVVAADRHGTVRYRVAGRIPVRDDRNRRRHRRRRRPGSGLDRLARPAAAHRRARRTGRWSPPTSGAGPESDADRHHVRAAAPRPAACTT